VEIAAQVGGDVVLAGRGLHREFAENCTFFTAEMIEYQSLGRDFGNIAVGDEKLRIPAEAAVAVGVEEFWPNNLVFGLIGVLEKHVPDFAFDAERGHDFVWAAPGKVGDAAGIWDYFAEVFAVDPGGEHRRSEGSLLDGPGEEKQAVTGWVDHGVLNE